MRTKYRQIKNMQHLDDELELSLIRRQVLLNEINGNIDNVRSNFSLNGFLRSGIGAIFPFGSKQRESSGAGKLESILKIASSLGGIFTLLRAFKRSK